jgi:hypothetical protein
LSFFPLRIRFDRATRVSRDRIDRQWIFTAGPVREQLSRRGSSAIIHGP